MSSYTLEGILYRVQSDPAFRDRFQADPQAVTSGFPLSADEQRDLLAWDVRAMSARGVSDMLMMVAFTMINGQQGVPEYMRRMNGGAPALSATS